MGHRGEFPDILKGKISGLKRRIEVIEGEFEVLREDFRPGELI